MDPHLKDIMGSVPSTLKPLQLLVIDSYSYSTHSFLFLVAMPGARRASFQATESVGQRAFPRPSTGVEGSLSCAEQREPLGRQEGDWHRIGFSV